jgi:hypothetical protein
MSDDDRNLALVNYATAFLFNKGMYPYNQMIMPR